MKGKKTSKPMTVTRATCKRINEMNTMLSLFHMACNLGMRAPTTPGMKCCRNTSVASEFQQYDILPHDTALIDQSFHFLIGNVCGVPRIVLHDMLTKKHKLSIDLIMSLLRHINKKVKNFQMGKASFEFDTDDNKVSCVTTPYNEQCTHVLIFEQVDSIDLKVFYA